MCGIYFKIPANKVSLRVLGKNEIDHESVTIETEWWIHKIVLYFSLFFNECLKISIIKNVFKSPRFLVKKQFQQEV